MKCGFGWSGRAQVPTVSLTVNQLHRSRDPVWRGADRLEITDAVTSQAPTGRRTARASSRC